MEQSVYLCTKPDKSTVSLHFRWTISRGRDTEGYNICTLYANGKKAAHCNGGGYDMRGTCLADWLASECPGGIKRLPANYGSSDYDNGYYGGYYGLHHRNTKTGKRQRRNTGPHCQTTLDGACGWESISRIMDRLGYQLQYCRTR